MKCPSVGISVFVAMLAACPVARAQDPAQTAAEPAGMPAGMDVHGSAEVGVRSTTVSGSEASYERMFNLSDGPRLMNLELQGKARAGSRGAVDAVAVSVSGVGDPFAAVQFTMSKVRRYDVRLSWRRSRFIDESPLTPASIDGLDTGVVADAHAWTTSRQIGNAALVFDATSRLHLLFNYARVARTGALASTRSLDFVGAPTVWGTFARANPYPVTTPVDDASNRFTGGISYALDRWTVNYQAGYQRQDEHQSFALVAPSERSINVADATTAPELLQSLSVSQDRRLTGPTSELSYVGLPHARVEWRGTYLFSRDEGPFSAMGAYAGIARTTTTGTAFSSYDLATMATGRVTSPNHVLTQAVSYRPADQWAIDVEYRYSRFAMEAQGLLTSQLTGFPTAATTPAAASESDEQSWRQASHTIGVFATYEPVTALTIRPGVRVAWRDVERREGSVLDPATSNQSDTVWPEILVGYQPSSSFSARGSYRIADSDVSYTRLSPVRRSIGRVVVRVQPAGDNLTIEAVANQTDAELPAAGFVSHTRLGSLQGSYKLGKRVTATGGLDDQSFLGLGNVSFLRGTAPIADDVMTDRERDRLWLAGISVRATDRISITATGNFLRVTGTDAIAGEPPLYGPMSFPYGTGSVSYDIPKAGKLSIDLQRSHLAQDILPLNDFKATLLTVRFSRDF